MDKARFIPDRNFKSILTELISSGYLLFLLALLIASVNSWAIHTPAPWQINLTKTHKARDSTVALDSQLVNGWRAHQVRQNKGSLLQSDEKHH